MLKKKNVLTSVQKESKDMVNSRVCTPHLGFLTAVTSDICDKQDANDS